MRKFLFLAAVLLAVSVSCIDKDPSWVVSWGGETPSKETPAPTPQPQPQPGPDTTEVVPVDVSMLGAFVQDFKTGDMTPFLPTLHQNRDDFRYYPGFPSLSELNTDILMLRLDPSDSPSDGARLTASDHTFYGSYSIRIKTPDLALVRKTTDAVLEIGLAGEDPDMGVSALGMKWELSNPTKMTLTSASGSKESESSSSVAVMVPDGRNPSVKFQTYGWDWTADCVRWWILNPTTKEKTVLLETTAADEIPSLPGILSISVYHTSDAPEYPFELEIDSISYEPYQDLIEDWKEKFLEK